MWSVPKQDNSTLVKSFYLPCTQIPNLNLQENSKFLEGWWHFVFSFRYGSSLGRKDKANLNYLNLFKPRNLISYCQEILSVIAKNVNWNLLRNSTKVYILQISTFQENSLLTEFLTHIFYKKLVFKKRQSKKSKILRKY